MTHAQLVNIAHRWLLGAGGCGVAFKELVCSGWETADAIGFGGKVQSIVVECKTSRSDYLADQRKPFRVYPDGGMGTHRIYCAPVGLLRLQELPAKWALLEVGANSRTRLTYRPDEKRPDAAFLTTAHAQKRSKEAEQSVMYSALRRLQALGVVEMIHPKHLSAT